MTTLNIPAKEFADGVNSVIACASADKMLSVLAVVRVEWDETSVRYVTTDRYVLAEQTMPRVELEGDPEGAISIPLDVVKSTLSLIKAGAINGVSVKVEAHGPGRHEVAGIRFDGVGEFPKYGALFPADSTITEVTRNAVDPGKLVQLAGPKVKGRYCSLLLEYTGEAKIIRVRRLDGTDLNEGFRGLAMPIRMPQASK